MSSKKKRLKLAKSLSQHLSSFGECFDGIFLCPTCMSELDTGYDFESITAGHIVPESAGGKRWTLLCKSCNSEFGKLQDKWFGEYICILKNPEGSFLHAKSKNKYITVNGITVSGLVDVSEDDGAIEVILPTNMNPPGKVDGIHHGDTISVQFTPELVKHVNEIQVGYITAAYLTWFNEIGYNWVMQSSQGSVRKQIMECNYKLDGAKVVELQSDKLHDPAIGVIIESGYVYPCCLMYDRAVIFPPPNGSKAPSLQSTSFNATYNMHLLDLKIMNVPYAVNFDGGIAIMPNMLRKDPSIPEHMLSIYANANRDVQWLRLSK